MNVGEFLKREILNDRMNINTLLTVEFKKKNYLSTVQECNEIFGRFLVKKCEIRMDLITGKEMKNSFDLKVI